ncbi:MAG TPA: phospholipase A [Rubrivivax sp.]|nr:phospholipase A [Rubrivivax sp.]
MHDNRRLAAPPAILGATLMAALAPAWAQVAPAALAECAAIAADSQRLACFDRLSGRPARPAAEAKPEAAPAPAAGAPTAAAAAPAAAPAGSESMFDKAWQFDPSTPRYGLSPYAANYLLLGRYTNDVNTAVYQPLFDSGLFKPGTTIDSTEAAFQLSFKFRLLTTDDRRWALWAAYTQQSQWQVYNDSGNASRPFRETNYMPELIVSWKPGMQWGGWQWNLLNLALNHQSNGRSDVISRSWNRVIAGAGVENGNFALLGRLWWRIPESDDSDDNPTISDYYGWGDLSAIYKWRDNSFAATIRGNPSTGKGAGQLTFTSVPLLGPLRGYVKLFSGYGETMIDYNWKQTTIGVGVTLNDWL